VCGDVQGHDEIWYYKPLCSKGLHKGFLLGFRILPLCTWRLEGQGVAFLVLERVWKWGVGEVDLSGF
jgi:hypothetical protein